MNPAFLNNSSEPVKKKNRIMQLWEKPKRFTKRMAAKSTVILSEA
jgi:hypothetical protein